MKKNKILFVTNTLTIGGIEKSLIELLNAIYEQYDIDLYCIDPSGPLAKYIPHDVHLIPTSIYSCLPEKTVGELASHSRLLALLRGFFSVLSKIGMKSLAVFLFLLFLPRIKGKYDVAISYSQPINDRSFCKLSNEIVLYKCNAIKKATFLHCDFEKYEGNTKRNKRLYRKFDAVVPVSNSVGKSFVRCTGVSEKKMWTVYNVCNYAKIQELADIDPLQYQRFCFVMVARLSKEKGIDRVLCCAKQLVSEGYFFEINIIGGGSMYASLHEMILKNHLNDIVFLRGEQINPYRYMRNANCLLVSSYHEAAPMVFLEAISLNVPIITTDTLSAREIVEKNKYGIVCENSSMELYNCMKEAINNGIHRIVNDNKYAILKKGVEQFRVFVEEIVHEVHK